MQNSFPGHGTFRFVLITACWIGTLTAQGPSKITFSDNFSSGPSPLWSNYTGNWTAVDGQYFAQSPNDNPLTYTGLPFVLADYTLTVKTVIGDGGIWLRSKEGNPYGQYILLVLGGDNYGQGARGGDAGNSIYFATASQSGINQVRNVVTPGDTYVVTVKAQGDTYSVFLNGATTPVATLTDSSMPYGQVGLYDDQPNTAVGGFGAPTTFSNFQLSGNAIAPQVSSVIPNAGKPGTVVTIRGVNLQSATGVTFNGATAQFTQSYPGTDIQATVPSGATSGPIVVTTPLGAANTFTVLQ